MLATATPTVTALPDRPVAERPESREDSADGRFAGLMAHWIQPQAQARADQNPSGPRGAKVAERVSSKQEDDQAPERASSARRKTGVSKTPPTDSGEVDKPRSKGPVEAPEKDSTPPETPAASPSDAAKTTPAPDASVPAPSQVSGTPAVALDPAVAAVMLAASLTQGNAPKAMPSGPTTPDLAPSTEPLPSALTPSPSEGVPSKGVPGAEKALAEAMPPPDPALAQAALAEGASQIKEKAATKEDPGPTPLPPGTNFQASAPVPKAAPVSPASVPVAPSPAKGSLPVGAPDKAVEFLSTDPETTRSQAQPRMADGLPAAAVPIPASAPTPAPELVHSDGNAMAVIGALPRPQAQPAGSTPTPPPAASFTPPAPVAQVEVGMRWMLKGGSQEAQLQLHPESLGQVTIHLRVEGGEVHARLWVTEASSVQAVQEGRPHLEASLKEQGLQLGSFDLQHGQRPFQEATPAPMVSERTAAQLLPARQETPLALTPSILNAHRVELYA